MVNHFHELLKESNAAKMRFLHIVELAIKSLKAVALYIFLF